MKNQQGPERILFEDKDVKITDKYVQIKWYFFPFGQSKKIPIKSIRRVQKRKLGFAKARLWGMDATHWGYWLAGDKNRFSRQQFIGITVQSSVKPSFTTQKVDQVYRILIQLVGRKNDQLSALSQNKSSTQLKEQNLKQNKSL